MAGTRASASNVFRRDVLGDAPGPRPPARPCPCRRPPPDKDDVVFTLSVTQLRINQRISQAAIRRLNAVEARPNGGLTMPRPERLLGRAAPAGARHHQRTGGRIPGSALAGRPGQDRRPRTDGAGDPLTLSAAQLLINQRIDQAAIRRATGIGNRLDAGLTGGDVRDGQVTQGKLFDRLQILAKAPTAEPAATKTAIPPRKNPPDPGSVTLSTAQLRINQRIAQAGVRNANALIRRLETGLAGADLRPGTLTATDLG